ncbi:hypothetical protein T01_3974 [Trichinella spiralis]|uniref:Uncharacterized protein n=1 Tax=Trichinella spiralis TaxID=6334 RepID=A0A0V1BB90_TRISP|nr:hypothetical protein T01_3974 [Trichinella spiralis]
MKGRVNCLGNCLLANLNKAPTNPNATTRTMMNEINLACGECDTAVKVVLKKQYARV